MQDEKSNMQTSIDSLQNKKHQLDQRLQSEEAKNATLETKVQQLQSEVRAYLNVCIDIRIMIAANEAIEVCLERRKEECPSEAQESGRAKVFIHYIRLHIVWIYGTANNHNRGE